MQIDTSIHKQLAVDLFNGTWELLDTENRTAEQDESMVHMAHASRYHWGVVGTPMNRARGEWLIARVYAKLQRYAQSLHHAKLYFEACKQQDVGSFDLAFAYEGLARAIANEQPDQAQIYITEAQRIGEGIDEADDRTWLQTNLDAIAAKLNAG